MITYAKTKTDKDADEDDFDCLSSAMYGADCTRMQNLPGVDGPLQTTSINEEVLRTVELMSEDVNSNNINGATTVWSTTSEPILDQKLPPMSSLAIVIKSNVLLQVGHRTSIFSRLVMMKLQISFFIIISSSSAYSKHLGGSATFSGLVIGIPTVFSGIALLALMRVDQGLLILFICGTIHMTKIL